MDPQALSQILQAQAASFQQALEANNQQTSALIGQFQQSITGQQEQLVTQFRQGSDAQQEALNQIIQQQAQQINAMQSQIQSLAIQQSQAQAQAQLQRPPPQTTVTRIDTDEQQDIRSVMDPRLVERVERFSGEDAGWPDFRFDMESTAMLIGLDSLLADALEQPDESLVVDNDIDDADTINKAKAVWYLLSKTCKGKAKVILQACPKGCGFLAWKDCAMSMLQKLQGDGVQCSSDCFTPSGRKSQERHSLSKLSSGRRT